MTQAPHAKQYFSSYELGFSYLYKIIENYRWDIK